MINILDGQDKENLFVCIDGQGELKGLRIEFHRHCASEIERNLLRCQLNDRLHKAMKEIRRVAYLTGWRDAKSKRVKKCEMFACATSALDWERKDAGL